MKDSAYEKTARHEVHTGVMRKSVKSSGDALEDLGKLYRNDHRNAAMEILFSGHKDIIDGLYAHITL